MGSGQSSRRAAAPAWPPIHPVRKSRSDGGSDLTLGGKSFWALCALLLAFDSASPLKCLADAFPSRIAARSSGLKLWRIAPLNLVGMHWLYLVVAVIRSYTLGRLGCCGRSVGAKLSSFTLIGP